MALHKTQSWSAGGERNVRNDLLNFQLREISFILFSSDEIKCTSSRKTKNCQLIQLDGSIGGEGKEVGKKCAALGREMETQISISICVWIVYVTFFPSFYALLFFFLQLNWPFRRNGRKAFIANWIKITLHSLRTPSFPLPSHFTMQFICVFFLLRAPISSQIFIFGNMLVFRAHFYLKALFFIWMKRGWEDDER